MWEHLTLKPIDSFDFGMLLPTLVASPDEVLKYEDFNSPNRVWLVKGNAAPNIFNPPPRGTVLNVEPVMITDYGTFVTAQGRRTFKSFAGQQVSIFLMDNKEGEMKSEGLRWNSYGYREWWQGTLNEALGDSFTLDTEREYVVFQTHEKKEKSRF